MSDKAYFCEKTGVRLKEPGVSKRAGGQAEEYDTPQSEPKKAKPSRRGTKEKD